MHEHLEKSRFALAKTFTPILNSEQFEQIFGGKDGKSISVDAQGLLRSVETVAFPKTKFELFESKNETIVRIKTADYPYGENLFVDSRFLVSCSQNAPERIPTLPSPDLILNKMRALLGLRYFWGGNCLGLFEMLQFYPPKVTFGSLDEITLRNWTFQGVDCSGLIYLASQGTTPRNTSSWISYGEEVDIEGKTLSQILDAIQPLDAVVWPGHIFFIESQSHTIESLGGKGVVSTEMHSRFHELVEIKGFLAKNQIDKKSSEKQFVIRRWHPQLTSLSRT